MIVQGTPGTAQELSGVLLGATYTFF